MLVLTRKLGESVIIGGNIEVKITEISGDKVRIGIEAPAELKILRGELLETIEENQEARASVGSMNPADLMKRLKELH